MVDGQLTEFRFSGTRFTPGATMPLTFDGVTVTHALDAGTEPGLTAISTVPAPGLLVQDLVVGTGAEATPTSQVTVHYKGVLYADGSQFDAVGRVRRGPAPINLPIPPYSFQTDAKIRIGEEAKAAA